MSINRAYFAFLRERWPYYTAIGWAALDSGPARCGSSSRRRVMLMCVRQRRFRWARADFKREVRS